MIRFHAGFSSTCINRRRESNDGNRCNQKSKNEIKHPLCSNPGDGKSRREVLQEEGRPRWQKTRQQAQKMSVIKLNPSPSPTTATPHPPAKIIHIIPATGWSAEYQDTPDAIVVKHQLICWALVEENTVIGMISAEPRKQSFATEWGNFIGYKYEK